MFFYLLLLLLDRISSLTMHSFLYLTLFLLSTFCKSSNSLYAHPISDAEDNIANLFVRRYLESNNLLYARALYDRASRRSAPHDALFRRSLAAQILTKRTLTPHDVQETITDYERMSARFKSQYSTYSSKFSSLNPTKSHAARAEVAVMERVVLGQEAQWRASRDASKDLVYKNAKELRGEGREREARELKAALDAAYFEGERVQELIDIFKKQNEDYQRTGRWPKWPGTAGSSGGESSTKSTKEEEGTSAGGSKSQGSSKSGKGRRQSSGKGRGSGLRKGFL